MAVRSELGEAHIYGLSLLILLRKRHSLYVQLLQI